MHEKEEEFKQQFLISVFVRILYFAVVLLLVCVALYLHQGAWLAHSLREPPHLQRITINGVFKAIHQRRAELLTSW